MNSVINWAKALLHRVYRCVLRASITILQHLRGDHQGMIYVDPLLITHTVNRSDRTLKRNVVWHFGTVADGDWDLNGAPIQKYGHVYSILKQRVVNGLNYDEMPEFRENLERIKRGETPDNCSSEKQYRAKYVRFEHLCKKVKSEGYKTQKDLGYQTQKELRTGHPFNEILVQVGRRGNLLLEKGIHRLAIAQVLKLQRVPVIITRRHAEWVEKNKSQLYLRSE
ncbi:hypothetical protein ES707_14975 [subsurface metagenome]